MIDYYEILGVSSNSDDVVIRAAYKAMMSKYHPDVSGDKQSEGLARKINEAFSVLGDPAKRRSYDEQRGNAQKRGESNYERTPPSAPAPPSPPPQTPPTSSAEISNSNSSRAGVIFVGIIAAAIVSLIIIGANGSRDSGKLTHETSSVVSNPERVFDYTSRLDKFTDTLYSSASAKLASERYEGYFINARFDCRAKQVGDGDSELTGTFSAEGANTTAVYMRAIRFRIARNDPYEGFVQQSFGQIEYTSPLYDLNRRYGGLTGGAAMMVRIESGLPNTIQNDATINLADPSLKRVFADCRKYLDRREELPRTESDGHTLQVPSPAPLSDGTNGASTDGNTNTAVNPTDSQQGLAAPSAATIAIAASAGKNDR